MVDPNDLELSDTECDALHDCQLAIEYVHRAYGDLLDFHHNLGHAMDLFHDAEAKLRAAGHEELAETLCDDHLPAGVLEDRWSYEIVSEFRTNFLDEITDFETRAREELADGVNHLSERRQRARWRERAGLDE